MKADHPEVAARFKIGDRVYLVEHMRNRRAPWWSAHGIVVGLGKRCPYLKVALCGWKAPQTFHHNFFEHEVSNDRRHHQS